MYSSEKIGSVVELEWKKRYKPTMMLDVEMILLGVVAYR